MKSLPLRPKIALFAAPAISRSLLSVPMMRMLAFGTTRLPGVGAAGPLRPYCVASS
jgi:hypothetical protein